MLSKFQSKSIQWEREIFSKFWLTCFMTSNWLIFFQETFLEQTYCIGWLLKYKTVRWRSGRNLSTLGEMYGGISSENNTCKWKWQHFYSERLFNTIKTTMFSTPARKCYTATHLAATESFKPHWKFVYNTYRTCLRVWSQLIAVKKNGVIILLLMEIPVYA